LGGLLARKETQQDAFHRVKVDGVDERVDAVVQVRDAQQSVIEERVKRDLIRVDKKQVNVRRSPGDCE